MSLRINFYGGPGVGKSTLAARVYADLKQLGVNSIELVPEFIKPWAYEGKQFDSFGNTYVFGNQLWSELRFLNAGVDIIVSDSPMMLQCAYAYQANKIIGSSLRDIALQYEKQYPSLNFFVDRTVPGPLRARYQTKEELETLDCSIRQFLQDCNHPSYPVRITDYDFIMHVVKLSLTVDRLL